MMTYAQQPICAQFSDCSQALSIKFGKIYRFNWCQLKFQWTPFCHIARLKFLAEISSDILTCSIIQPVIKKQIQKEKLQDWLGIEFARKECVIHSQMAHDNIVKLHEYTENDKEFVLFMEYCNDANYFEEKLVNVSLMIIKQAFVPQRRSLRPSLTFSKVTLLVLPC